MTLKEHIDDIREGLEADRYRSEAQVPQGIVLRLLAILDWPTFTTEVVIPEYRVEGTRVDFALCHPLLRPVVFVEVKQVGGIEGAEQQLFQYAFHEGVPIAILTDGREWHFFTPSGQGNYRERRVYKLDLIEENSEESAMRLNRYLAYESIRTGEAIRAIEDDYRNISTQRQIEASLPEAWGRLVQEADGPLLEIVAEKVEELCRYRPTGEQTLDFLRTLNRTETDLVLREIDPPDGGGGRGRPRGSLVVTLPDGEKIDHNIAATTFAEVIEKLGIERVRRLEHRLNGIPLISTSYYPQRGQRRVEQYYVTTFSNNIQKKRLLEEIATGLGERLEVEIVERS